MQDLYFDVRLYPIAGNDLLKNFERQWAFILQQQGAVDFGETFGAGLAEYLGSLRCYRPYRAQCTEKQIDPDRQLSKVFRGVNGHAKL